MRVIKPVFHVVFLTKGTKAMVWSQQIVEKVCFFCSYYLVLLFKAADEEVLRSFTPSK